MKQWEKLTAWLVVFALVAGLVGGSAFVQVSAAEENSDFAYVVNEDGTATITEVKTNAADVIVPAVIDGHTVTAIGSHTSEWSTTPAGAFESKCCLLYTSTRCAHGMQILLARPGVISDSWITQGM